MKKKSERWRRRRRTRCEGEGQMEIKRQEVKEGGETDDEREEQR